MQTMPAQAMSWVWRFAGPDHAADGKSASRCSSMRSRYIVGALRRIVRLAPGGWGQKFRGPMACRRA
jgi:hypothetical protein